MAQVILSVRMDEETKKGLEDFCKAVGMTPSTAVNLFAKTVIRERRFPFEIATEGKPPRIGDWNKPEEVMEKLAEAERAVEEGRVIPAKKAIAELRARHGF